MGVHALVSLFLCLETKSPGRIKMNFATSQWFLAACWCHGPAGAAVCCNTGQLLMGGSVVEQQEQGCIPGSEEGDDNRVHQQVPARGKHESGPAASQEKMELETATYNIDLRSTLEINKPTRLLWQGLGFLNAAAEPLGRGCLGRGCRWDLLGQLIPVNIFRPLALKREQCVAELSFLLVIIYAVELVPFFFSLFSAPNLPVKMSKPSKVNQALAGKDPTLSPGLQEHTLHLLHLFSIVSFQ